MNDSRPTTPTVNPNTALFEGTELDPIAGDVDREVKRVMRRGLPDGSDPLVSVDGRRVSDFDSPVARAVAAVLEQLNDPEFLRTSELSPAWLKAETTGYTLRPSTAETEKTPVIDRTRERDVLTVYNRGFSRPTQARVSLLSAFCRDVETGVLSGRSTADTSFCLREVRQLCGMAQGRDRTSICPCAGRLADRREGWRVPRP